MTTLEKLEELIYHGFKETDQKFQETGRLFKENREQIKEHDRLMKDVDKRLARLTDSLGLFAENMVKPAVARLFAARGIVLTNIFSRAGGRYNGAGMEWDVLGHGPQHVIAVEVKLKLGVQDVKDTLERLPRFFDFFERFRGLILYGAVAGMSIDEGADRHAYQQGLFVLAQSGENIRLLNDEKFIPRAYTSNQPA